MVAVYKVSLSGKGSENFFVFRLVVKSELCVQESDREGNYTVPEEVREAAKNRILYVNVALVYFLRLYYRRGKFIVQLICIIYYFSAFGLPKLEIAL